jgi:hypothetical protein
MKLKMLTGMAGRDFALSPGEETERFTGAEAERIVAAGYAVPVAEPKIERAVAKPAREKRG